MLIIGYACSVVGTVGLTLVTLGWEPAILLVVTWTGAIILLHKGEQK